MPPLAIPGLGSSFSAPSRSTMSGSSDSFADMNQHKLKELRARLIANRNRRSESKLGSQQTSDISHSVSLNSPAQPNKVKTQAGTSTPVDEYKPDLDALLAEGQAQAKILDMMTNSQREHANLTSSLEQPQPAPTIPSIQEFPDLPTYEEAQSNEIGAVPESTPGPEITAQDSSESPSYHTESSPESMVIEHRPKSTISTEEAASIHDGDDEVNLWLELTGYNDPAFREKKLRPYRLRKALDERQKALDAERAELDRLLAEESGCDRNQTPYMPTSLPTLMPPPLREITSPNLTKPKANAQSPSAVAGAKRPFSSISSADHGGKKDRQPHEVSKTTVKRAVSPSSTSFGRRLSFPDRNRDSAVDKRSDQYRPHRSSSQYPHDRYKQDGYHNGGQYERDDDGYYAADGRDRARSSAIYPPRRPGEFRAGQPDKASLRKHY